MSILILAEHNNIEFKSSTLNTISAASKINNEIEVLVLGYNIENISKEISNYQNVTKVLTLDDQKFEIDYWGVSNKFALEHIVKDNFNKDKITIGVASFTNLYFSKKMLDEEIKNKLIISGQDFNNADFIYNNNYFEVDPKYDDKYSIPKNYKKYSEFKKGKILISEFYIKK